MLLDLEADLAKVLDLDSMLLDLDSVTLDLDTMPSDLDSMLVDLELEVVLRDLILSNTRLPPIHSGRALDQLGHVTRAELGDQSEDRDV